MENMQLFKAAWWLIVWYSFLQGFDIFINSFTPSLKSQFMH